jgi:catechol 2,3-dioxygenase
MLFLTATGENHHDLGLLKGAVDHGVSRSVYTADPDGNEIELYCDAPREEWEGRVDEVMTVKPLRLD